jgi:hypothetical protein
MQYSTYIGSILFIEILNPKTFFLTLTSTLNSLITDFLTTIKKDKSSQLLVEALAMLLQKCCVERTMMERLVMSGLWVSYFMEWYVVHYHFNSKTLKIFTKEWLMVFIISLMTSASKLLRWYKRCWSLIPWKE